MGFENRKIHKKNIPETEPSRKLGLLDELVKKD